MSTTSQHATPGPAHRSLHQAWWSLVLFPVGFVVAMVVGEGIPAWLGYSEPSFDTTPWWVITVAGVTAVAIFAAPLLVTWHFSTKAVREGEQGGRLPLVVAGVTLGAFVLLNLLGLVAQLLT